MQFDCSNARGNTADRFAILQRQCARSKQPVNSGEQEIATPERRLQELELVQRFFGHEPDQVQDEIDDLTTSEDGPSLLVGGEASHILNSIGDRAKTREGKLLNGNLGAHGRCHSVIIGGGFKGEFEGSVSPDAAPHDQCACETACIARCHASVRPGSLPS